MTADDHALQMAELLGRAIDSLRALLDRDVYSEAFVRQQARETLTEYDEWQASRTEEAYALHFGWPEGTPENLT